MPDGAGDEISQLATYINYADLNNSVLRTCGHVSAVFFPLTSYFCKQNTMVFLSYCFKCVK